jgi:NAD(P)-dependent dehydrogenase (short-subunit alcohol dehydrogenase family)
VAGCHAEPPFHRQDARDGVGDDDHVQAIPIARPGTPEDIAAACEFLCSDKASYVTGQEINVNGGSWM